MKKAESGEQRAESREDKGDCCHVPRFALCSPLSALPTSGFFHNSLNLSQWLLVGMVPFGILALYFLKLRRQQLEVPSTHIWYRVVEDLRVNSWWQRLRGNLFLILQLLIAGLVLLALLRPGWKGETSTGGRFIFLIDNSASMSATDGAGERGKITANRDAPAMSISRLQRAINLAAAKIHQLGSGISAMIITFSQQTEVVQEFTDNRSLLLEALHQIGPTAGRSDFHSALALAAGLAKPGKITSEEDGREYVVTDEAPVGLLIFSDGRFEEVHDFSLGNLHPIFLPIGSFDAPNLAITSFGSQREENRPDRHQAYVQVANYSSHTQRTVVELHLDRRLVDAAQVEVIAGEVAAVSFQLTGVSSGSLQATLDTPSEFDDQLRVDDSAYAVISEQHGGRVLLVTPGNKPLELVLSTERAGQLVKIEQIKPDMLGLAVQEQMLQAGKYNLVIYDQCSPANMPQSNTCFVGQLPPLPEWQRRLPIESLVDPRVIDWNRAHPLMNLVELGNVRIAHAHLLGPPAGGQILIDSSRGPLMAIAPRGPFEDAVLGFDLVRIGPQAQLAANTNWPRRRSFPTFWMNVLEYLAVDPDAWEVTGTSPGESIEMHFAGDKKDKGGLSGQSNQVDVFLPNGDQRRISLFKAGKFAFHETFQPGIYEVRSEKEQLGRFAVNLFDPNESDIRLRTHVSDGKSKRQVDSISIGYVDIAAQPQLAPIRRELWKWLLLMALIVLVFEWYLYHRRVSG